METFIFEHAHLAHWVIFGLFFLASLNVPISEDFLIIVSALLASNVVPENTWKLFAAVFLGAYLSDLLVYGIGRWLGPNLKRMKFFSRLLPEKRIAKISSYYQRYGIRTLLVGRFIPFGVRNCLFITAGIGKMAFWKFVCADAIACFTSNTTLFTLSYFFGKNLTYAFKYVNIILFSLFVIVGIGFLCYRKARSQC